MGVGGGGVGPEHKGGGSSCFVPPQRSGSCNFEPQLWGGSTNFIPPYLTQNTDTIS